MSASSPLDYKIDVCPLKPEQSPSDWDQFRIELNILAGLSDDQKIADISKSIGDELLKLLPEVVEGLQYFQRTTRDCHFSIQGLSRLTKTQRIALIKGLYKVMSASTRLAFILDLEKLSEEEAEAKVLGEASREAWIESKQENQADEKKEGMGAEGSSPIAPWIKEQSYQGKLTYYPHYCDCPRQVGEVYRLFMGNFFLKDLLDYISQDPKDLPFNELIYRRDQAESSFLADLKALADFAGPPLKLNLVHRLKYICWVPFYSDEEFQALLALLKAASEHPGRGVVQVNLASQSFNRPPLLQPFTVPQLEQLIALIEEYNSTEKPFCELLGICDEPLILEKKLQDIEKDIAEEKSFLDSAQGKGKEIDLYTQNRIKNILSSKNEMLLRKKLAQVCQKNYRIMHKKELLTALEGKEVSIASSPDRKEDKFLRPFAERKSPLEKKGRPGRPGRPGLFKDFLSRLTRQGPRMHVDEQQQQQQQQQQHQEQYQQQERRQDVNEALQALDEKSLIHFSEWKDQYSGFYARYKEKFTPLQRHKIGSTDAKGQDKAVSNLWSKWTLDGHALNGFTPSALNKILEHVTLFREGFNFDALPQGFFVARVMVAGKKERILCYDSNLPPPSNPLAPRLKPVAARVPRHPKKTDDWGLEQPLEQKDMERHLEVDEARFATYVGQDSKDKALLAQLMNRGYCYKDTRTGDNGVCDCLGCTITPAQDEKSEPDQVAQIFSTKEKLREALNKEVLDFKTRLKEKPLPRYSEKRDDDSAYIALLDRYFYGEDFSWGERINRHSQALALQKKACKIRRKVLARLFNSAGLLRGERRLYIALNLPEEGKPLAEENSDFQIVHKFNSLLRNGWLIWSSDTIILDLDDETLDNTVSQWQEAAREYHQNLKDQRLAFYRALWPGESPEAVHAKFPVLRSLSLRHLTRLLEIAESFDLEPQDEKPDSSAPIQKKAVDALLEKLTTISRLDESSRTFDVLLKAVFTPSDSWQTSLIHDQEALCALHGITQLSPADRANWNWLLERHGESCGYADLGHLWKAFQHFNQEYQKLCPGDVLDLTRFHPDSVNNAYLFLDFTLVILANARDKREQAAELSAGRVQIHSQGAYYAARHQHYYLVSEEMELVGIHRPVDRSRLLKRTSHRSHVHCYIGQQAYAALSLKSYRKAFQDCDRVADSRFLLLVLTTAHRRAAERKESEDIMKQWSVFIEEAQPFDPDLEFLVNSYQDSDFTPLIFIECVTLWRLLKALPLKQKKEVQQGIIGTLCGYYNIGFLRVLREVYAQNLSQPEADREVLPSLFDYLQRFNALQAIWPEKYQQRDEEQKEGQVPAESAESELYEPKWYEQLCLFVSRIAAEAEEAKEAGVPEEKGDLEVEEPPLGTSTPAWQRIVAQFRKLDGLRTTEGHSIAQRLIVMLSGLPPAALDITKLHELLLNAEKQFAESTTDDLALFSWLKQQGGVYDSLVYPCLNPPVVDHSEWMKKSIEGLLPVGLDSRLRPPQIDSLKAILTRLWDPRGDLGRKSPGELESAKQFIVERAKKFLEVLLNPKAAWGKRPFFLITFLFQHPHLEFYSFDFLRDLLVSIDSVQTMDQDLSLLEALLYIPEASVQSQERLMRQASFIPAIKAVCALKNPNMAQRKRMLALVRHCVSLPRVEDEKASHSSTLDALLEIFKTFAEDCPSPTRDALLEVLDGALKPNNSDVFISTVESLKTLSEKDKKITASLLYGLARNTEGLNAEARATILKQCASEQTSAAVLKIFALQLGRKDTGEEAAAFLNLLVQLEKEHAQTLTLLQALCQHPPKLGIQKLTKALMGETHALLAQEKLAANLCKLELDPHASEFQSGDYKSPYQQEALDESKLASKLGQVTSLSRHAEGQPSRLFGSQQQELLAMVKGVREFAGSPIDEKQARNFINSQGEQVSGFQLTQAEIASKIKEYGLLLQNPELSEKEKKEVLLEAIALMYVAMYRATGKFANDSQIAAICNAMVRQTKGKRFLQIDTGQGKTLVNGFNAACMWLLRGEVLVLTSDSGLAHRDLELNRGFFQMLGIPVADTAVEQTSAETAYCQRGINYSTFAGLSLWAFNMKLKGVQWVERLLRRPAPASSSSEAKVLVEALDSKISDSQPGLVVDEVDDAFFACHHIDYRYAIPQLQTDSLAETPLAVFYEAMVKDFMKSEAYQALIGNSTATEAEAAQVLENFLFKLPYPYSPSVDQLRQLRNLLDKNPRQLSVWLGSLHTFEKMRPGIDFTVATIEVVIEGEPRKIKRVCPYSSSGRPSEMQFADGLQQFLQAKYKQKDPDFLIQQESDTLLWGNNQSIFARFSEIVGVTGTVGSAYQVGSRLRRWGFNVHTHPPHQDRNCSEGLVQYCDDDKAYEKAIKQKIRDYLKDGNNDPILLLAWDAEQLKAIDAWVKEVLAEDAFKDRGIIPRSLNGEQSRAEEKDIIEKGGHKKSITLATRLGGRGFDLITDDKVTLRELRCSPPPTEAESEQWSGRVSRQGKKGSVDTIVKKSHMVAKSGRVIDVEAKYAQAEDPLHLKPLRMLWRENEAWESHQWELVSEPGYVRDELISRFLRLYGSVQSGDDDLREHLKFAQINLLKDLEASWESIKEDENLQKLWLEGGEKGDRNPYYTALAKSRTAFRQEAVDAWNTMLSELGEELNKFEKRPKQVQPAKAEPQPAEESELKSEVLAEPVSEGFSKEMSQIRDLLSELLLTEEALAEAIPKEQLPYFELPTSADAGVLEDADEKEASDPRPRAIHQALCVLVKMGYIHAQTPDHEAVAAITAFLRRDYSDPLQVNAIHIGEEEQHRRIREAMPSQTDHIVSYGLRRVSIEYSDGAQTHQYCLYLDWNTVNVLKQDTVSAWLNEVLEVEKSEKERQEAERRREAAEKQAQEEKERRDQEARNKQQEEEEKNKTRPSAFNPPGKMRTEQGYEKWYWLFFALVLMGGGCALLLLGPPSLVATLLSVFPLTLSTTMPVLAALGLGYGLAAFIALFMLVKLIQAVIAAINPPLSSKLIPDDETAAHASVALPGSPTDRSRVVLAPTTDELSASTKHGATPKGAGTSSGS